MRFDVTRPPSHAPDAARVRIAEPTLQAPAAARPGPVRCRRATLGQSTCARSFRPGTQPADCLSCRLRDFGLTVGLSPTELDAIDDAVAARRRVEAGAHLYSAGQSLRYVYAVRRGALRSGVHTADGREQVTGFHLAGELLGLDAVGSERYLADAVALEDAEVWAIPYGRLIEIGQRCPRVAHNLQRLVSQTLAGAYSAMLLLGRMSAQERVAAFLLNLSRRYAALGCAADAFSLPMGREDMANYLGLTVETVSRALRRLQDRALVQVRQREVRVLDACALERVFDETARCP